MTFRHYILYFFFTINNDNLFPKLQFYHRIPYAVTQNPINNFLIYKNSNHGLTIQYPADWEKRVPSIPFVDKI